MAVTINILKTDSSAALIRPCEMLNSKNNIQGNIFQEYAFGAPCDDFFICCGPHEKGVVHIWYNNEDGEYQLSTSDLEDLRGYNAHVQVKKIEAKINLNMEIK